MKRLRVAVGVGGRFHADRMVPALLGAQFETTLYTTYPSSRFGTLPASVVRSFLPAEIVFRLGRKLHLENAGDLAKSAWFSHWWGKQLQKESPDLIIGWSSFSEGAFRAAPGAVRILVRDSAHIQFQTEHLTREYAKRGFRFPDRSPCIERELREYQIADYILLPSEFARQTFVERGFAPEKLKTILLGVDTATFRPSLPSTPSSGPLRVVFFGSLSLQKGIPYLLEATQKFSPGDLQLTLIGPVEPELKPTMDKFAHFQWLAPMDHSKLSEFLRTQDVFVMPSLHDGFGLVVPQAMASGLVSIVSDHCGARQLITEGTNGFVVEAANAKAIAEKLEILRRDRLLMLQMRRQAAEASHCSDWNLYAQEVRRLVQEVAKPTDFSREQYRMRGKILHLRQTKLGHLPPAVSATQMLTEAGVPQLVIEYGMQSPEWCRKIASDVPRIRFGDPYNRFLPPILRASARVVAAFLRVSKRILFEGKPAFILSHGVIEQAIAYFLNRVWNIPYACYVHEIYDLSDVSGGVVKMAYQMERKTLQNAEFTIFPSKDRSDIYRSRYSLERPSYSVANCPRKRPPSALTPIDLRQQFNLSPNSVVVGYMGGIGKANGIEIAIKAVSQLPNVILILWGWGVPEYLESLKNLANAEGCGERVLFAGEAGAEKWSLLESCDISLCIYEAKWLRFRFAAFASNKFLESIAVGRPVITNGSADFKAIVEKYDLGVALRDLNEETLRAELSKLISDASHRKVMSSNAYRLHNEELHYEKQFEPALEAFRRYVRPPEMLS